MAFMGPSKAQASSEAQIVATEVGHASANTGDPKDVSEALAESFTIAQASGNADAAGRTCAKAVAAGGAQAQAFAAGLAWALQCRGPGSVGKVLASAQSSALASGNLSAFLRALAKATTEPLDCNSGAPNAEPKAAGAVDPDPIINSAVTPSPSLPRLGRLLQELQVQQVPPSSDESVPEGCNEAAIAAAVTQAKAYGIDLADAVAAAKSACGGAKHVEKAASWAAAQGDVPLASALANALATAQAEGGGGTFLANTPDPTVQDIYFNGLAPGWSDISDELSSQYRCDCDFEYEPRDNLGLSPLGPGYPQPCSGSKSGGQYQELNRIASMQVSPWGSVVLRKDQEFSPQMVLEFYARGTGLERSEIYLMNHLPDTRPLRKAWLSEDVPGLPEDFLIVMDAAPVNRGWKYLQVDLRKISPLRTIPPGLDVAFNWSTIIFNDVSGSGFSLQIAQMRLKAVSDDFNISDVSKASLDYTIRPWKDCPSNQKRHDDSQADLPEVPILNLETPLTPKSQAFGTASVEKEPPEEPPNEFLMKIREGVPKARLEEICNELRSPNGRFKGSCKPRITSDSADTSTAWRYQPFTADTMDDVKVMAKALASTNDLEFIEKDLFALPAQDEDDSVSSWGLDRIDQRSLPLDDSYTASNWTGAGTHIYVLDSGVRASHKDFEGRVGESKSLHDGLSALEDVDGHGTHVAGTALGASFGIARNATLHSVKVLLGEGKRVGYGVIVEGLQWAVEHVRRNNYRQAVAVMSISGDKNSFINNAVADAVKAGIIVVVAAGNLNAHACTKSPASALDAIVVAATTRSNSRMRASNWGSCCTLFAPGEDIVSADAFDDNAEASMSGTSMAAPHVAGVVAMLLEKHPGLNASTVKEILRRTGTPISTPFEPSSPNILLSSRLSGSGLAPHDSFG